MGMGFLGQGIQAAMTAGGWRLLSQTPFPTPATDEENSGRG